MYTAMRNYLFTKRSSVPHAVGLIAGLFVLTLSLSLTGCGKQSLKELLQNEEPGKLHLSPTKANIPVDTTVTVQGKGGFQPYSYEKLSGGGTLDPKTGIFDAPGTADTVTIEVTDYFGEKARGTLEIFKQLRLFYSGAPVSQLTVNLTDLPLDFDAADGLAPYVFSVGGATGSIDAGGLFDATDPGEYTIEVSDSMENSAVATVRVLDIGGPLTIDPEMAYVLIGQTIDFTAYNYDPATYAFSVQAPAAGSITPTTPATYTPPIFEAVDTIVLSDALATVTATVHVLSTDPLPLTISPASFGKDLEYGDVVIFTVSGGLPSYTFWLEYEGSHGTLEQISATQARYEAPNTNTVDWVWVKDTLETKLRVKTKVSD
jgi:hypothetical protein